MKILIFIDKLSPSPTLDEEDTLTEAKEVKASLVKQGYKVIISQFSLNLENNIKIIEKEKPDLIFNLVETLSGSDTLHITPLLFEKNKIKYTGGSSNSLYLTGNKIFGKEFLINHKIKTPKFYYSDYGIINKSLINNKVIVKDISEEASCGICDESVTIFNNREQIKTYIKKIRICLLNNLLKEVNTMFQ